MTPQPEPTPLERARALREARALDLAEECKCPADVAGFPGAVAPCAHSRAQPDHGVSPAGWALLFALGAPPPEGPPPPPLKPGAPTAAAARRQREREHYFFRLHEGYGEPPLDWRGGRLVLTRRAREELMADRADRGVALFHEGDLVQMPEALEEVGVVAGHGANGAALADETITLGKAA